MLDCVASILGSRFELVGKVGDGGALVAEAQRLCPDLIVSDISMPILNGIEAARRLFKSGLAAKVVFMTLHPESSIVEACFVVGALGFVSKERLASDLIPAVNEAFAGRRFVSPSVRLEAVAG
jgi:DNA-binding NarL/FixJ family response regulator